MEKDEFGYLILLIEELSCLALFEEARPKIFPRIIPDVSVTSSSMLLVVCCEFPLIWRNLLLTFFAFSNDLAMRCIAFIDFVLSMTD